MSVLKIAAGVFLRIAAILIVLKIPLWTASYKEDRAIDEAWQLTPDVVIERCGKPTSDKVTDYGDSGSDYVVRDLEYNGLTLEFHKSDTSTKTNTIWHPDPMMSDPLGTKYGTATSKFEALPCLKGQK